MENTRARFRVRRDRALVRCQVVSGRELAAHLGGHP